MKRTFLLFHARASDPPADIMVQNLDCAFIVLHESSKVFRQVKKFCLSLASFTTNVGDVAPSPCRPELRRPNLSYLAPTS